MNNNDDAPMDKSPRDADLSTAQTEPVVEPAAPAVAIVEDCPEPGAELERDTENPTESAEETTKTSAAQWPPADYVDAFQRPDPKYAHFVNAGAGIIVEIPLESEEMKHIAASSVNGLPLANVFLVDETLLASDKLPLDDFVFVPTPNITGRTIGCYVHNPLSKLAEEVGKLYGALNLYFHNVPVDDMPHIFTPVEMFILSTGEKNRIALANKQRQCFVCKCSATFECICGSVAFCSPSCKTVARMMGAHTDQKCVQTIANQTPAEIARSRKRIAEQQATETAAYEEDVKRTMDAAEKWKAQDDAAKAAIDKETRTNLEKAQLVHYELHGEQDPELPDMTEFIAKCDAANAELLAKAAAQSGERHKGLSPAQKLSMASQF